MRIGAQFYTVKDFTKDLKSFDETLKKVADIGFKTVQISGTCDFNAAWLRDKLKEYGLKCVLTHTAPDKLINATEYVIEDHRTFGCDHIGLGAMPYLWNSEVSMEKVVSDFKETFIPVAEKIRDAGMHFMYHNHDLEFTKTPDGKRTYYDVLIDEIDPSLMGFTVDTYWVQAGGEDPADMIRRLKGRCSKVHFKDYKILRGGDPALRLAACGDGNLNFEKIAEACEYAGVEDILIEQDNCYGEDPFECLERSYKYLKSLGIEK